MSAPAVIASSRQTSRDFWTFWTGESISNLGSSFTTFALPLLVFKLTGSALNLGLATAISTLPYLLFGLVIGAWVDRLDRKRLMIVTDLLLALALASVPLLALLGYLTVWWLYGVSFVSATLKIFFECGQFAAVPSLVGKTHLVTANGRIQASFSGAQMAGPVLAGVLLFVLPLPTLMLFDAASFLVSACTLSLVRQRFHIEAPLARRKVRQEVMEGLRYVWQHPLLRAISCLTPLINLLVVSTTAQLVVFATIRYHAENWQISLLYSAASAGLVVGSLAAGPLRKRWSFSQIVLGAVAACGGLLVALALLPEFWLGVGCWWLIAGATMLFNIHSMSLRQAVVPNHLLGRVSSSARVLSSSMTPIGALLGGAMIAWVGKPQVALVYAGIGILVLLLPLCFAGTALGHAECYLPGEMQATPHRHPENLSAQAGAGMTHTEGQEMNG